MISIVLLLSISAWIGWGYFKDWQEQERERERRLEKTAMVRRVVEFAPDSPSAYERLGDALRQADDPAGAVEAYEKATELASGSTIDGSGVGWLPGEGIETKLRLARLDLAETVDPARYGQTMRTRQQVCRACGFLGLPNDQVCTECGAQLPVDTMMDAWRNDVMRGEITAEVGQVAIKIAVVLAALLVASWMPWEIRGAIAIAAVIVIPFRLLKRLGQG